MKFIAASGPISSVFMDDFRCGSCEDGAFLAEDGDRIDGRAYCTSESRCQAQKLGPDVPKEKKVKKAT